MKIIHTTMVYTDGTTTVYRAYFMSARTSAKQAGGWHAKIIGQVDAPELVFNGASRTAIRNQCDEYSRNLAARFGVTAGPDAFPYAI